jgi:hypothetical protein
MVLESSQAAPRAFGLPPNGTRGIPPILGLAGGAQPAVVMERQPV